MGTMTWVLSIIDLMSTSSHRLAGAGSSLESARRASEKETLPTYLYALGMDGQKCRYRMCSRRCLVIICKFRLEQEGMTLSSEDLNGVA
eukprot:5271168-Amphidinium_carterae.2